MIVAIPPAIRDNVSFLVAEVSSQVAGLQSFLDSGSPTFAQRILVRSGYAENLRARIHESSINHLACNKSDDTAVLPLRAMEIIATNLERVSERSRECIQQIMSVSHKTLVGPDAFGSLLDLVTDGLEQIEPAIAADNTQTALRLGEIEAELDAAYGRLVSGYTEELKKKKKHAKDIVAALFVAHSISRMGDALLAISEAIISAKLGQPVNMNRYQSLQDSIAELEPETDSGPLQIETVAETRSGSRISGIARADQEDEGFVAIYKDGEKRKLKEERQGVQSWHEIYPGLAPRIISYKKHGKSAALLIEHLAGLTMEQILLHESDELLADAQAQLNATLKSVWKETRTKKPAHAQFMRQTRKRMHEVYGIHPRFRQTNSVVCDLDLPSFDTLLERAEQYEKSLEAPFSVYIHGDFNVDNVIYDPLERRINFIDLHRSRYMDYVQDVSVFMVSNYRLQVLNLPLRRRIMALARAFCQFARAYADKTGDETFELRLALGLARSFATSTRFILDKSLSRRMFLRSRYLIEQVLALSPENARKYKVPIEELFIG